MITLPLFLSLAPLLQSTDSLAGRWAGGYPQLGEYVSMEVRFRETADGLDAELALSEKGFRLTASAEREGAQVSWTVADEAGAVQARFRGELDGATLRGRLDGDGIQGEVELDLLRVVEPDAARREAYAGTYRLDGETTLQIVRVRRSLDEVLGIDFAAESVRAVLYPVSTTELVAGDGERPLPIATRLAFQLDDKGRVERLELELKGASMVAFPVEAAEASERDSRPTLGPGLDVERRDVRVPAGDVELAATLYLPPGVTDPVPAVVQLHGSGPGKRHDQWYFYTSICLRSGLAVLAYDKRGCGESTGRFKAFSVASSAELFDRLAGDAAAAHAWLREQEGIDPERVGLVGGSQAGWIMPLVAEKTEGVAFILAGCGPTVSAGEEEYHSGLIQAGVPTAEADRRLERYDGPRGYDPRPVLRRVETPILWLFGERDDIIPTAACLEELERLRAEGHLQHDVHVFRDADHNYQTSRGDSVLLEPVITRWLAR
jgi:hypothetical protein